MTSTSTKLLISISEQRLYLQQAGKIVESYPVNTAKNGVGENQDSECTPRGLHSVADKIGADEPANTVFVGRKKTGEYYQHPDSTRDWILTRIIRLRGEQPNINKGAGVDTYDRYIYIHGSPDDSDFSKPLSRGCIRMRNADIINLFDRCAVGDPVIISETCNFATMNQNHH